MRVVCDGSQSALVWLARWVKDGTLGSVARLHRDCEPEGGTILEPLRSGGAVAVMRSACAGEPLALAFLEEVEDEPYPERLVVLSPENDARLPGGALLGESGSVDELIHDHMTGVERCDVVTYHPERRCVVRLSGRGTGGRPTSLFLKLFSRRAYQRAAERLEKLPRAVGPLGLALPLVMDPDHACMLFERAPGRSLHEALSLRGPADLGVVFEVLEAWSGIVAPAGMPRHDLELERQSTLSMLEQAKAVIPVLAELQSFVAALSLPEIGGDRLVHGDLHDKQLFVAGGEGTLIDLDQVAVGSPLIDMVNLSEHLLLRSFQGLVFQEELEPELCRRLIGDADPRVVSLLRGLMRARLAGVYARRPEWHSLVPLLVALAAEVLTEEM